MKTTSKKQLSKQLSKHVRSAADEQQRPQQEQQRAERGRTGMEVDEGGNAGGAAESDSDSLDSASAGEDAVAEWLDTLIALFSGCFSHLIGYSLPPCLLA